MSTLEEECIVSTLEEEYIVSTLEEENWWIHISLTSVESSCGYFFNHVANFLDIVSAVLE